ncbi:MAG: right-handed parallel beta-helix repeat-containing protein, partial [Aureliella sp.]
EADDSNDFAPRTTDFYVYAAPAMSIQAAIDAAVAGDVINIAAGTFNENVSVNKSLSLVGAGNGSGPGDTIISATGTVLTVTANNVSIEDLRVTGGARGVFVDGVGNTILNGVAAVGNYTGVEVGGTTATGLQILNSTLAAGTNGFRMGTGANLDGLTIDGSTVTQNAFGISVYSVAGSYLKNVVISDSSFADNSQKGMYFEKLADALIDDVVVENSGVDPTYAFNNGIDVNLKYGSYSNITIQNSTFSGSGVRTVYGPGGLDFAAALAIKARDDGSYSAVPATLSNVLVKDNVFQDSSLNAMTTAVRVGEPAKNNAGPTSVKICHNDLTDGTFVGVDNTSLAAVDAEFNWWGTTNGATIDSVLALGNVDFTPWLLDSVASGNNLVFTGPDDVSLVVNQATGAYVFVDSNGEIYSGSGASVKNGKLKIHDESSNGKIDVKGSADGSVSVSLKGKGKPTNFTLDPLATAC